jgi:hypothetical protein
VASGDTAHAIEVIQGHGMPLNFLEDAEPVLAWLQDQPPKFLDARPPLWLMLAWSYLATSQHSQMRAPMIGAETAIESAREHAAYPSWLGELNAVRMGDVDPAGEFGAFFNVALPRGLVLTSSARRGSGVDNKGVAVDLGPAYSTEIAPKWYLSAGSAVT